jgi:hypothetical protein
MQACGFSLNLQAREEPFGMVVIESMRAGCIVLASSAGAFPEIVQHGYNGFLIGGDHTEEATQIRAAELILELSQRPDYSNFIRRNAIAYPLDWSILAEAWEGHWDWALGGRQSRPDHLRLGTCPGCGADWLPLADGLHCTGCGRYQREPQDEK